jgi:hypothetical protein
MSTTDTSSRTRRLLLWGLAAAAMVLGFIDLWRGGITVAPILLILAYCVLIPLAILKS